jgi:hypothetical protein
VISQVPRSGTRAGSRGSCHWSLPRTLVHDPFLLGVATCPTRTWPSQFAKHQLMDIEYVFVDSKWNNPRTPYRVVDILGSYRVEQQK